MRKTTGATTVRFIYHGAQIVAEYDGSGAFQRHYTFYPGTDQPHSLYTTSRSYYLSDHRGNVTGLLSGDGATLLAAYRYTPFGTADSTSETVSARFRFAGRELDPETGLYYNRARYYDPQLGRFVSEDPGGALNQYAYAGNDPVNQRDPSGAACQMAPPAHPVLGRSEGADDDGGPCGDFGGVGDGGWGEGWGGGWGGWGGSFWGSHWYDDPLFLDNGHMGEWLADETPVGAPWKPNLLQGLVHDPQTSAQLVTFLGEHTYDALITAGDSRYDAQGHCPFNDGTGFHSSSSYGHCGARGAVDFIVLGQTGNANNCRIAHELDAWLSNPNEWNVGWESGKTTGHIHFASGTGSRWGYSYRSSTWACTNVP